MTIKCENWHSCDEIPEDGQICLLRLDDGDVAAAAYCEDENNFYVNFGGCGFVTVWDIVTGWAAIEDCKWSEE